jgi:hypothetical protein
MFNNRNSFNNNYFNNLVAKMQSYPQSVPEKLNTFQLITAFRFKHNQNHSLNSISSIKQQSI